MTLTRSVALAASALALATYGYLIGSSIVRTAVVETDGGKAIASLSVTTEAADKATLRRTSTYTDNAGKELLTESMRWNNTTALLDRFESADKRTGKVETYVRSGNSYVVSYRKNSSSQTEKETFEAEKNTMPAPMLPIYLASQAEALAAGKEVEFRLLVAERMDTYGFDAEKTAEETISGVKTMKITVTASSFLIRQLAGKLSFNIEKAPPHRLMRFTGRLPLTDADGSAQMGSITYK